MIKEFLIIENRNRQILLNNNLIYKKVNRNDSCLKSGYIKNSETEFKIDTDIKSINRNIKYESSFNSPTPTYIVRTSESYINSTQNDPKIYSQNRNLSINKESTSIPVKELYNRDKSKYSTIQNSEDEGKLDNNKNKYFYQLLNEDNSINNNNIFNNIYQNNFQKEKRLSNINPIIIDDNVFNFDRDNKHNKFVSNIKNIEDYSDTFSNYNKQININNPITNDDIHSEKQYLIDILPNEKENYFFDICNNFNTNGKLSI